MLIHSLAVLQHLVAEITGDDKGPGLRELTSQGESTESVTHYLLQDLG